MAWTCAGEAQWIYWTKDLGHGAARQEEMRKTTDKVLGEHGECCCDRGGC